MNLNKNKYRVEILKIFGLAMLTPFGRLFLDPLYIISNYKISGLLAYATIAFITLVIGIIFINRGLELTE